MAKPPIVEGSASSTLDVHWHEEIEGLAPEWDDLADRVGAAPFMRPGWIAAWWEAFGAGALAIASVRRDSRLIGVLPLHRRRGALQATANWHTPAFDPLVEDAQASHAIAEAIYSTRPRRVSLMFTGENAVNLREHTRAAEESGYRMIMRTLDPSCYVAVEGNWATYERRLRKGRLADLRRCRRRLEELGRFELDTQDGSDSLEVLLEEGFRLEASGWKREKGTAILSHPGTRKFYTDVARWAAERRWLRLNFLRLDGRPLAFHMVIADGLSAYHLKSGYDPAFSKFAPGMLIIQDILAKSFDEGSTRVEFLGLAAPYKLEWADRICEQVRLQAFAQSAAGLADWTAFAYARPVIKRVARSPHARRRR